MDIAIIFIVLFIAKFKTVFYLVQMIKQSFVGKNRIKIIGRDPKRIDCIWGGLAV